MEGRLFRRILLASFFMPGLASADLVNGEWMSTTRVLSMGNAGIASAEDPSSAAFYNPAALAKIRKSGLELVNPQIELGGGTFTVSRTVTDWIKQGSFSKIQPLLRSHPGVPSSAGYSFFPNASTQNFSFGILLSGNGSNYYSISKDAFYYSSRKLLIPSLGISVGTIGGLFRIGLAARGVQIQETNIVSRASATSSVEESNETSNGFGVGLDGGILMSLPWSALPTFGFVARNIGGVSFPSGPAIPIGGVINKRHGIIKMVYDAGFSLSPKFAQQDRMVFALDYRDVLDVYKVDIKRRINLGIEFGAGKMLFFRAGFGRGYPSGGIGLNFSKGSFDLGTYGEELDAKGFHGVLDRRYSIRITRLF